MLHNIGQVFIRTSAFLRKEIVEILRQPRLLLTLILGPFLILLVFGIGYHNQARALRTLFVAPEGSPIRQQIEEYATTLGAQLIYEGVTSDEEAALRRLRNGEVDVVAVTPVNAYETIRHSQSAVFTLYHREIDPFQVDYVSYFGQVYIDEVNRRVLYTITRQGQENATTVKDDIAEARTNATNMRQALQAGDAFTARQEGAKLAGNVNQVTMALGATLGILSGVQQTLGDQGGASDVLSALAGVQENTDALNSSAAALPDTGGQASSAELARIDQIDADLGKLESQLDEFTSIDASVLVRPFTSQAKSIATVQPTALGFFAPAVVALLLQHLAVTLAALSIVRERAVGTMELFRVSPLAAGETLIGKYLSYMIFGGVMAAGLTALLIFGLKVPMLGNWWHYVLAVAILLFTSLGFGFLISILSQTDTQAVQLTMIMLLTSVFFSGFLMSLDLIIQPVRAVSWAMPTTYGIILLRDIMLRGIMPNIDLLWGLAGIGVFLFLVSWFLLRRMISTR